MGNVASNLHFTSAARQAGPGNARPEFASLI
jgi:hypothetical protein